MKRILHYILLVSCAVIITGGDTRAGDVAANTWAGCLPAGVKPGDAVEIERTAGPRSEAATVKLTVEKKLDELRAHCDGENHLVDGTGRPIAFYHLIGCWGNPPPNYQELLQKQRNELEQLRKDHTVIELSCNPTGVRIP